MEVHIFLLLTATLAFRTQAEPTVTKILPSDLHMGAASSAHQVEGAWNEDWKGENIWDRMAHSRPEKIEDRSTADVACDAYHKTKEDVALMKGMGLQTYRFSLAWSRILPSGFPNRINQAGVDYYNELIDELKANHISPIVTIFHWDLPQPLQDLGGWTNPAITTWFKDYARIVFDLFGDRVKLWITINEPKQTCQFGYGTGVFAPGVESDGIGDYICAYNLLKAHAEVYHLYDKEYKRKQRGRIGITVECAWTEPATNRTEDIHAADRRRQFDFGLYTNPVYHKDGDFPKVVREFVDKRSKEEGFTRSRLPKFTSEEVQFIKNTSDFFGLNHYTTLYAKHKQPEPIGTPSTNKDMQVEAYQDPNWLTGSFSYFRLVPWGFRKILNYIKDYYGNPDILVTENGFPDLGELDDKSRIKYYTGNLGAMLDAIHQDKVKVKVYTAWTLMDNYEWASGYTVRFGFHHVNFTDPNRSRTPKASSKFYANVISSRKLTINAGDEV